LAFAPDGQLAGLMNLHARPPFTDLSAVCPVSKDFLDRGLGTSLLEHAERRATTLVESAPAANEPSFLRQWTGTNSRASIELLAARGYTPTRALLTMHMEVGEASDPADAPQGIDIRPLIPGKEERAYYEAEEEAFANHWGFQPATFDQFQHYVLDSPKWDPTLAFLAIDDGDVAGVMLLQAGTSWDEELGWFDDLAVRERWRRRGIARALMHVGIAEMRTRGMARVGLEVDSENEYGAVALYKSVGMHEKDRVVPYEKRIR
jgi:mycothiol synthase